MICSIAGRRGFRHHIGHIGRRQKLPLLDVHRQTLGADVLNEVRLSAQKRRGLQHAHDAADLVERRVFMHIGQHRQAQLLANLASAFRPSSSPGPR